MLSRLPRPGSRASSVANQWSRAARRSDPGAPRSDLTSSRWTPYTTAEVTSPIGTGRCRISAGGSNTLISRSLSEARARERSDGRMIREQRRAFEHRICCTRLIKGSARRPQYRVEHLDRAGAAMGTLGERHSSRREPTPVHTDGGVAIDTHRAAEEKVSGAVDRTYY
eukprot:scaffold41682_cov31-Tisochrysis_lutea.AAC.2